MNNLDFWLLINIKTHESKAQSLAKVLDVSLAKEDFNEADLIAAAADRLNFPNKSGANFSEKPYLSHPLTGEPLDLTGEILELRGNQFSPNQIDSNSLQITINKSLEFIPPEIKTDPQKLFLWLWRCWSTQLQNTENNQLGVLWDLLPADTRIPDHSIWQHQALTSAIATTKSNPAFLLFTIGPVQAFISAARRTQDLWAGSYILSYLNWAAIESIANEIGPDAIIFPSLLGQPLCDRWLHRQGVLSTPPQLEDLILPSLPNRFLAIVPADRGVELAKEAAEKVKCQWRDITQTVRQKLEKCLGDAPQWSETWERQTENLFNTYWQVYPWRPTGKEPIQSNKNKYYFEFLDVHRPYLGDRYKKKKEILEVYAQSDRQGGGQYLPNIGAIYSDLYFITEKALGSRKALRNFPQVDETGEKSTLGGDRAALYDGIDSQSHLTNNSDRVGRKQIRKFWQNLSEKLKGNEILPDGKERLDAVELTKRCAWKYYFRAKFGDTTDELRFPSTNTVASASFKADILAQLKNNDSTQLRQALENWVKAVYPVSEGNRSHTAVIPYLAKQISNSDQLLEKFLRLDGRLLYAETYQNRDEFSTDIWENKKSEIKAALKALQNLLKVAQEYQIPQPRKYFAVLMMDGDNMGQWLAGEKMPEYQRLLHPDTKKALEKKQNWEKILKTPRLMSPAIHGFVSKALGDFSLKLVRHIVENRYPGKLVYAGGDDVLALLPLDCTLNVSRELRAAFSGEINTVQRDTEAECQKFEVSFGKQKTGYIWLELEKGESKSRKLLTTMGYKATASTGIVITHRTAPLDLTLQEVRKAEKQAKNSGVADFMYDLYLLAIAKLLNNKYLRLFGFYFHTLIQQRPNSSRNGFAITFLKRSGEIMNTNAKWYDKEKSIDNKEKYIDTIELLLDFQQRFKNGQISGNFVYTLKDEAEILAPINDEKLFAAEIKRLLKRQEGKQKLPKEEIIRLADRLAKLAIKYDLEKVSDLLILTRFLATAEGEE